MAEETESEVKINWTDPIVWHDPILEKETVAKLYVAPEPTVMDDQGTDGNPPATVENSGEDQLKTEGVFFPIIQLNNTVIERQHVLKMELDYTDFVPKLFLSINDPGGLLQFKETPGINNIIKIVIIPPEDGAYRKISLSFKITSYTVYGETLNYNCEYKLDDLNKDIFGSINFEGCDECSQKKNGLPNTWEYLHHISKKLGLGFASTEECKNIADNLPRLLQNITYNTFINESILYGGLDEKSIFDCWIDLYGYIVLVNIPWIFNEDIKPEELQIVANFGLLTTQNGLPEGNISQIPRTLTNYSAQGGVTNINIESYKDESNPGGMYFNGNLHTIVTFNPKGVNDGSNNIKTEDILSKEYSIDGDYSDEYTISRIHKVQSCFVKYNIHKQRTIRTLFLDKIKLRKLEVVLSEYNLGLQRGTLVNVAIFEDNMQKKAIILNSSSNVLGDESTDIDANEGITNDNVLNEGDMIMNFALSGLYYIDGMRFDYDMETQKIKQTLILLKKGVRTNYTNKHTNPKLKNE